MPSWLTFHLHRVLRQLWVTAAAYCVFAIAAALASVAFAPLVPQELTKILGSDAVDQLLEVMAGSMLAVATFSLAAATTVFGLAAQTTTPRAVALLVEDRTAQRALSTFVGAFLYSVVGLVALSTGYYGAQGRVILFLLSILVIGAVIVTLIRWIDRLTHFGRVGDTIERVERATVDAVLARLKHPHLGGRPFVSPPEDALNVCSEQIGYLQHIDMDELKRLAHVHRLSLHVLVLPGAFVHLARPVLAVAGACPDAGSLEALRRCFVVGDRRTFESDPRFGLIVLSEIASRALSPAVNDPGTAIEVIAAQTRILTRWGREERRKEPETDTNSAIYVKAIAADDLFDDAFSAIARDGAAMAEVVIMLLRAMEALAAIDPAYSQLGSRHTEEILQRAGQAISSEADLARVRAAAKAI